jgi:hypothetical protein
VSKRMGKPVGFPVVEFCADSLEQQAET